MIYPLVNIIIATFNSENKLSLVLESIKKQTYPKNKIKIRVIDGGSKDKTLKIAKIFGCEIINNLRTEPVYAKFLGYVNSKEGVILYLDHDEILENENSLKLKVSLFSNEIKMVIGTGYKTPADYHGINSYINEFGDPFSFFIYRLSKDFRYFINTMKKRYKVINETKEKVIFDLSSIEALPIIELCAAGSAVDLKYMKKNFPQTLKNPSLIPHFFYLLREKSPILAISKNDPLIHYSSETLRKYLAKIRWRIKNNIYHAEDMGMSGFGGRNRYDRTVSKYKKYLFLPYAFSIIFPLYDAVYLSTSRRKMSYLLHLPLTFYAAFLILYHYVLKLLGNRPRLKSYGDSTDIELA